MEIIITEINPHVNGEEVAVGVRMVSDGGKYSEEHSFLISAGQYSEFGYRPNNTPGSHAVNISAEDFERLEAAASLHGAVKAALRLLEYGDNTEGKLVQKLMQRGVSRAIARAAAAYLRERGFIKEEEMLRRAFERCIKRGWGRRRIMEYIHSEGYSAEVRELAKELSDETDFLAVCATEFEKGVRQGKFTLNPDGRMDTRERARAAAFLSRRGFEPEEIERAVRNWQG